MTIAAKPYACPTCGASVFRDRGHAVEATGALYAIHHCPAVPPARPEPDSRLAECVCGFVVTVYSDGRRELYPSGLAHRTHPQRPNPNAPDAEEVAGVEALWYAEEERRAGRAWRPDSGPKPLDRDTDTANTGNGAPAAPSAATAPPAIGPLSRLRRTHR